MNIFLNFLDDLFNIVSIIISLLSLYFCIKTYKKDHEAKIVASFETRENKIYLVIKNTGKSIASKVNIDFNPKLSTINHPDYNKVLPLITDYKDCTFLPEQEVAIVYDVTKQPFREFDVTIKYFSADKPKKQIVNKYHLNTHYLDSYMALNNI